MVTIKELTRKQQRVLEAVPSQYADRLSTAQIAALLTGLTYDQTYGALTALYVKRLVGRAEIIDASGRRLCWWRQRKES